MLGLKACDFWLFLNVEDLPSFCFPSSGWWKIHIDAESCLVCVWAAGRAGDNIKQRPLKQMSQPAMGGSDLIEGGRLRGSQSSEGSDLLQSPGLITSPPFNTSYSSPTDPSVRDPEFSEYSISFIWAIVPFISWACCLRLPLLCPQIWAHLQWFPGLVMGCSLEMCWTASTRPVTTSHTTWTS